MKKKFVSPTITSYHYAVATQLDGSGGSGTGTAHDAGNGGALCTLTASHGAKACADPSTSTSAHGKPCLTTVTSL